MAEVHSPDCPHCGQLPFGAIGAQFFCGNAKCDCLSWDGTKTPAELREDEE